MHAGRTIFTRNQAGEETNSGSPHSTKKGRENTNVDLPGRRIGSAKNPGGNGELGCIKKNRGGVINAKRIGQTQGRGPSVVEFHPVTSQKNT